MWNKTNLDSRIYVNQWYKTKKLNKHVIITVLPVHSCALSVFFKVKEIGKKGKHPERGDWDINGGGGGGWLSFFFSRG